MSSEDLTKVFLWKVKNFSSRYQLDGIGDIRLCRPYPFSEIFTTDYGGVTAMWMMRLISDQGERMNTGSYFENWNFYLDLVGMELESDNGVPLTKKCIGIVPGINIEVNCQLFLVEPKVESEEPFNHLAPENSFTFGANLTSGLLGWPLYTREGVDPDSIYYPDIAHELGPHNEACNILSDQHKWVDHEDNLHVGVRINLINIERTSEYLNANFISDIGRGLGCGATSDIVIKCGPDSFPAHQLILSLRSPVFKAMLHSEMKEATSGEITIEDTEPFVMKQFLEFLYTASMEFSKMDPDQAIGIIAIADKYAVSDLKHFCFQHLVNKLDMKTCGKLAVAAYLHGAEKYHKDRIYAYIAERSNILAASANFKALAKAYPAAFLNP